jgi:hypothetical protein
VADIENFGFSKYLLVVGIVNPQFELLNLRHSPRGSIQSQKQLLLVLLQLLLPLLPQISYLELL